MSGTVIIQRQYLTQKCRATNMVNYRASTLMIRVQPLSGVHAITDLLTAGLDMKHQ
mgnify:CR=1 FL=1